jgi:hypothetical protein
MSLDPDELNALNRAVSDTDTAADTANGVPSEDEVIQAKTEVLLSAADAWAEIPTFLGLMLEQWEPQFARIYTKESCKAWGKSMAEVAQKHGWSTDGLPPEIALVVCTATLAIPTVQIARAKIAAAKAKPVEPAGAEDGHGQKA